MMWIDPPIEEHYKHVIIGLLKKLRAQDDELNNVEKRLKDQAKELYNRKKFTRRVMFVCLILLFLVRLF